MYSIAISSYYHAVNVRLLYTRSSLNAYWMMHIYNYLYNKDVMSICIYIQYIYYSNDALKLTRCHCQNPNVHVQP